MRVLVTGITGMVGGFLACYLLEQRPSDEIHGTYRWRSRMETVEPFKNRIHLQECDVRDGNSVRKLIHDVQPDEVYHLAAQSNVLTSHHAPADTLATNVVGLVNLLEALRELRPTARILVPGSSEEYGLQHPHELPIRETNPLRPVSPYAVSKLTQDMTAAQYTESYGMHIIRTRAFNHIGPGRDDVFVESSFARQIAEIEAGLRPPQVCVGNLEILRDYSDARDIVRAYVLAMERAVPGEVYNICSERARRIGELLDILLEISGVQVEVAVDPKRVRPREAPVIVGDSTRFRRQTSWAPEIPLEQTLRDILTDWRERVRRPHPS